MSVVNTSLPGGPNTDVAGDVHLDLHAGCDRALHRAPTYRRSCPTRRTPSRPRSCRRTAGGCRTACWRARCRLWRIWSIWFAIASRAVWSFDAVRRPGAPGCSPAGAASRPDRACCRSCRATPSASLMLLASCVLRFSDARSCSDVPMSTGESDGFVSFLPDDAWFWRSATWLRLACRFWIAFCESDEVGDTTGHRDPLSRRVRAVRLHHGPTMLMSVVEHRVDRRDELGRRLVRLLVLDHVRHLFVGVDPGLRVPGRIEALNRLLLHVVAGLHVLRVDPELHDHRVVRGVGARCSTSPCRPAAGRCCRRAGRCRPRRRRPRSDCPATSAETRQRRRRWCR